jgi:hypothetical protein
MAPPRDRAPGTLRSLGWLFCRTKQLQEIVMSDPRYRDPRLDPLPTEESEIRSRRAAELGSSNAMWGWIAGAVVVALILLFIFGSTGPNTSDQATTTTTPPATTGQGTTTRTPSTPTTPPAGQGTAR